MVIAITTMVADWARCLHRGSVAAMTRRIAAGRRAVPAPELLEVAQTWWDVDEVPVVVWSEDGRVFDLVDVTDAGRRLSLLRLDTPPQDPAAVAGVLAEGLAACDFPPTDDRASPGRVRATLRAARVAVEPAADWGDDPA